MKLSEIRLKCPRCEAINTYAAWDIGYNCPSCEEYMDIGELELTHQGKVFVCELWSDYPADRKEVAKIYRDKEQAEHWFKVHKNIAAGYKEMEVE